MQVQYNRINSQPDTDSTVDFVLSSEVNLERNRSKKGRFRLHMFYLSISELYYFNRCGSVT